ncbi:MAG: zinc ribbon domain-containing protein [Firmicutes bacterium]|nr:zinc ribbon domain-containing protein [Bacillota bacterium]
MFCNSCGTSNADGAAFCNKCGKRVTAAAETPIQPQQQQQPSAYHTGPQPDAFNKEVALQKANRAFLFGCLSFIPGYGLIFFAFYALFSGLSAKGLLASINVEEGMQKAKRGILFSIISICVHGVVWLVCMILLLSGVFG